MRYVLILVAATASACQSPIIGLSPQGAVVNDATILATATAARVECTRAPQVREAYFDAIQARLKAMASRIKLGKLDCDGNGEPDF